MLRIILALSVALSLPLAARPVGPDEFRSLFQGAVRPPLAPGREALAVYRPRAELLQAPSAATAGEFLERLNALFRPAHPTDLYRHARENPVPAADQDRLRRLLRAHPVTFVIFPGVFSELIETRAFEEIFSGSSAFRAVWEQALARHAGTAIAADDSWSSAKLRTVSLPMGDLVNAASLDEDGKPLVRLILLRTPRLSLESLGTTRENVTVFLRRLEKTFALLGGAPGNLAFLGYSRGAMVALDFLSAVKDNRPAWLPPVEAMVSLGGVLYGSDLADDTRKAGTVSYEQARIVRELVASLNEIPGNASLWQQARTIAANTDALRRFVVEGSKVSVDGTMLALLFSGFRPRQRIDNQSMWKNAQQMLRDFGLADARFFTGYSDNIRRLREFLRAVLVAIDGMTTPSRERWWASHTIPSDGIRYFSIAGTMTDPSDDWDLARNPVAFNPLLFDYKFLLASYRNFRVASGFAVNDSQVAMHKVAFWPDWLRLLNHDQKAIESRFLGLVGTHHWGLTLEIVTPMADGAKDPFPRRALVEALGAALAVEAGAE